MRYFLVSQQSRLSILLFIIIFIFGSCQTDNIIEPGVVNNNKKLQEFLLRGWNTWNNADLLSYVYLPDGLTLKIGFRESYISEPPQYIDRISIKAPDKELPVNVIPVSHSSDGRYIDYKLEWKDFEARIEVIMQKGNIIILYTPVRIPSYPPVIYLEAGMLWGKKGKIARIGNSIQAEAEYKIVSIGATQNSKDIPLPLYTPYLSFDSREEIGFYTGSVRTTEQIKDLIEKRKEIFDNKQKSFGHLAEAFNMIQSALSWNMIYDPENHRSITPVSRLKAEKMGGWVLDNADSYYAGLMYATDDKFNAYSNAIAISACITENGFIPAYTAPLSTGSSIDHSRAPVGSLICNMIYKKYNDTWFLREVYDELIAWNRWWDKARNNKGFLSWGSQPSGSKSNTREAAMAESVLNGTPLLDDIAYNKDIRKMEVASVELISLYIADCKALAEIAGALEKENDQSELLKRAEKYSNKLNQLWDDQTGIYRDKNLLSNQFCSRTCATSFYSLLSGVPDTAKAGRMIREHLLNPEEFSGEYMVPLLARNDPAFNDSTASGYRIIPEINFLIYLGLKNYDFPDARKLLADKSLDLVMKEWGLNRRIYESYNPLNGLGSDKNDNDSFYTTGGLLALISLLEEGYWDKIKE
jgi:hypothetical protein